MFDARQAMDASVWLTFVSSFKWGQRCTIKVIVEIMPKAESGRGGRGVRGWEGEMGFGPASRTLF